MINWLRKDEHASCRQTMDGSFELADNGIKVASPAGVSYPVGPSPSCS